MRRDGCTPVKVAGIILLACVMTVVEFAALVYWAARDLLRRK